MPKVEKEMGRIMRLQRCVLVAFQQDVYTGNLRVPGRKGLESWEAIDYSFCCKDLHYKAKVVKKLANLESGANGTFGNLRTEVI